MAGISVAGSHGRRSLDLDLPLVPFIDFLLCLIAFLLVTAVWSQMARLNADARVPGRQDTVIDPSKERQLHVEVKGSEPFKLVWKQGNTVLNTFDVERRAVPFGSGGDIRYPELAKVIEREWLQNGAHRTPADLKLDQAVLHTDNSAPFNELVAVMDAIYTPKRTSSSREPTPAFNVTFAAD
ncbi:MAG TPA: biopolymer transporter ExbD [Polyangiaceae bacterium]|nr:biopolymer transporter ExbD [Polyangiaceae bacterium]